MDLRSPSASGLTGPSWTTVAAFPHAGAHSEFNHTLDASSV
jgi:hypothetical protein